MQFKNLSKSCIECKLFRIKETQHSTDGVVNEPSVTFATIDCPPALRH